MAAVAVKSGARSPMSRAACDVVDSVRASSELATKRIMTAISLAMRTILAIVGARRHALRTAVAAGCAAAMLAACGTAPLRSDTPTRTALPPSPESPLVKLARVSTPPGDEGLSGFRLMPGGFYSLDARIELAKRAQR